MLDRYSAVWCQCWFHCQLLFTAFHIVCKCTVFCCNSVSLSVCLRCLVDSVQMAKCVALFASYSSPTYCIYLFNAPSVQYESKKNPPSVFWHFFPNGWKFLINFFTNLLHVPFYTRLQIFIQLSPTLTRLCCTKRDHPTNFYISLEV